MSIPESNEESRQAEINVTEKNSDVVVSMSGGKDSTATYLYLLESGFIEKCEKQGRRVIRVFADTGWELPETYDYVEQLQNQFGKIHRVALWVPIAGEVCPQNFDHLHPLWATSRGGNNGFMDGDKAAMAKIVEARIGRYSPMLRLIIQRGYFPTSVRRWCTDYTKKEPIVSFLSKYDDPTNTIGVRAEESPSRAKFPAWAWSDDYDCWVWRPIKHWTKSDVISIHNRFGIAPNPLYLQGSGAGRVGCGPCVFSGKNDILWLSVNHPERIKIVEDIENMLAEISQEQEQTPKWFCLANERGKSVGVPIRTAVEWSQTSRGGRQMVMFAGEGKDGCTEWGLCESVRHENN